MSYNIVLLLFYFYVKSLYLKALRLSSLIIFLSSSYLCEFYIFALTQKLNIYCAAVESTYV